MADTPLSDTTLNAIAQAQGGAGSEYTSYGYGAPTPPPAPVPSATLPGMSPDAAQWSAQQQYLQAQQGYLNAKAGTLPAQQQYLQARSGVYDAQTVTLGKKAAQVEASSAYLAEQTRANDAARAEQQGIQAAKQNVGDIIGVTRAQRDRDNQAYRYQLAGINTPIEIDLPEGYTGPVPAGMVGRLQTLAEKLTGIAADNEKMRKFSLEAARIKYAEMGIEVDKAQLAEDAAGIQAGRAALTLDQAELAVTRAGLDVDQAGLRKSLAQMPPAPGYEYDDVTQQWMPKADLQQLQDYRKTVEGGQYGYFSVDALATETVRGTISEEELRRVLTAPPPEGKGLLPSTANVILESVRLRKQEKESDGSGLSAEERAILAEIAGGKKTTTTTPARGPAITSPSGAQYWNGV